MNTTSLRSCRRSAQSLIALGAALLEAGCGAEQSSAPQAPEQRAPEQVVFRQYPAPPAAMQTVATREALPACTSNNLNQLYRVEAGSEYLSCGASGYRELHLEGAPACLTMFGAPTGEACPAPAAAQGGTPNSNCVVIDTVDGARSITCQDGGEVPL
jgi:hypothetical protein